MAGVTTVTGLTKDRMIDMENATVIDGDIQGNDLHLQTRGGGDINAGNVRGPQGNPGANGAGDFICTSTTRPASPINGFSIYETDTGLRRTWTGTRWKVQERVICTSTTRPAGLGTADEGVYAFQTDTNIGHTWDGTRWRMDPRIICTTTTRPTGLVAADEGVEIYETDTNFQYVWTGTAWVRSDGIPHMGWNRLFPTAVSAITGNVYVDWPHSQSGGPLTVNFNKIREDSIIIVNIVGTCYITTQAGHRNTLGVKTNQDGIDREVSRHYINELGSHRQLAGDVAIVLPAGVYDFVCRMKTDAAALATAVNVDANDSWSMRIMETF